MTEIFTRVDVPEILPYRGTKSALENLVPLAKQWIDRMVDDIVDALVQEQEISREYLLEAAQEQKNAIRVHVESPPQAWRRPDYENPKLWFLQFRFKGTRRSKWADTTLVIRKDHTLNTEWLTDSIRQKAHALKAEANASARFETATAAWEAEGFPGKDAEGYAVTVSDRAPHEGEYFLDIVENGYSKDRLQTRVRISRVVEVIEAHRTLRALLKEAAG